MASNVARWRMALPALLLLLAAAACSERPKIAASLPAETVVVALGDSLTYGTGATAEASYPATLASMTGWHVINAGVPGETAAQGCARLPSLVDEHRPRLVIALLGGNDFLRRLPDAGIASALAQCARDARARDVELVLLTVPRLGWSGLSNADVYERVATEQRLLLVDAGLAELLRQPAMRADNVHLNGAGYREMASRIAGKLRESGHLAP